MKSKGFTLVELLLAITLMSMLLALAYGGLRASTRATDRGQVILEESGRVRMAHQFVRKQLNQMVPLVFMESEDLDIQEVRTVFEGTSQGIRFVGPMPGYLGFGGPQVQELLLVPGDKGLSLVISHALLQGFAEENLYVRPPIVLLDRIARASFQFLGLDEEGELAGWTGDWEFPDTLPVAIALDIEFEEEVFTTWPLLYASVRIDASAMNELAGEAGLNQEYGSAIRNMMNKRRQQN